MDLEPLSRRSFFALTAMAVAQTALRPAFGQSQDFAHSTLKEASELVEEEQKKFGLTPPELEIVSALVVGYSSNLAEYFKIGEGTLTRHVSNIFDKLGVSSRLELALFAVNHGLPLKSIE